MYNFYFSFASSTSDQYYKKLMEKYNKLPKESDKFLSKKSSATKALQQNDVHIKIGHRQRVSKLPTENNTNHKQIESKPVEKSKPKIKPAPVVNFEELLKIAAQKQHEDILVEVPTKKSDERPLTMKEKKELEEIEAARKAKLNKISKIQKIPKLNALKAEEASKQDKNNNEDNFQKRKTLPEENGANRKTTNAIGVKPVRDEQKSKEKSKLTSPKDVSKLREALTKTSPLPPKKSSIPITSTKTAASINSVSKNETKMTLSKANNSNKLREFPPRDLQKTREFPPRDLQKSREFPPRDLQRGKPSTSRGLPMKRPLLKNSKKYFERNSNEKLLIPFFFHIIYFLERILEDSDSEYDSEMDDFIDDGDEELDYSSEIRKIFKYDKSRYEREKREMSI
jgi:protein SPT2